MSNLYRAQILLKQEQHEKLSKLAAAEGRSMSAIVREAVAEYLVERNEAEEDTEWEAKMERLAAIRERIQARHGVLPAGWILRDREEREEELWQRMKWGEE
jgi:predicted transcriptional regulator